MLNRNARREIRDVPVQIKKKKSLAKNFQKFDQTSVFINTEDSLGNLLGVVQEGGLNPVVRVLSNATDHIRSDWPVVFRNRLEEPQAAPVHTPSAFKRTLSTVQTRDDDALKVGEIIELEGAMLDLRETTLYPWTYKRISSQRAITKTLVMPECLATIISFRNKKTAQQDYKIGIAARGEAMKVTNLLDCIQTMRDRLGFKEPMINGFIIRGTQSSDSRSKHGYTCFRTTSDDENNISDDQVILNFLRARGSALINKISEKNPWEIIPLYVVRPNNMQRERVDGIAHRLPKMVTSESDPYDACFAYSNVVLDFRSTPTAPLAVSFNISRSKPLILEAGLPERALERKLKTYTPNNVEELIAG